MACASVSLRKTQPFLVGPVSHQITGSKLPSIRQVLSVFYYNLRVIKLDVKTSAALAIKEVSVFWEKARIPIRRNDHCAEMLTKLHEELRTLQKKASSNTLGELKKRSDFTEKLDDLFDIAHRDALEQMTIEEDREFLKMQRMKGRPGIMMGVDVNLLRAEKRVLERDQDEIARKSRCIQEMTQASLMAELLSSTSSSSSTGESEPDNLRNEDSIASTSGQQRGTIDFFNGRLAATLDRCKISDRDAVHVLMATAEALGHDTSSLVINRNSISRRRSQFRMLRYKEMFKNFGVEKNEVVTVHWDGKLLPDLSGKKDRLAIFITHGDKEQLIGAPSIPEGSGVEQAKAVFKSLEEWGLLDVVQAMCFDTTASNTGRINGACNNIEVLVEKELLYLPCRHHIFEIVLKGVFDEIFGPTSGPEVLIFSRFKDSWSTLNIKKYSSGIEDEGVKNAIPEKLQKETTDFLFKNLEKKHCREDYKELLELAIIFLGGTPPRGTLFRKPGAISHARWMAKAIYCLKMFLFRNEFKFTEKEKNNIRRMTIFLIRAYLPAWYGASDARKAPQSDLNFLKTLIDYKNIDMAISTSAIKKFVNHLWYLAPETAALGFFDKNVSVDTKIKMVEAINEINDETEEKENKFSLKLKEASTALTKDLSDFITPGSSKLFTRYNIKTNFLKMHPSSWQDNEEFREGQKVFKKLVVVNDVAERGIQLITEYSNILTKNDEEKEFILHVVKNYRQQYPDSSKVTLLSKYNSVT